MTSDHSSESEGRQLTVAELLAQHGGEGRGSRRRRHTGDDEPPDTTAGSSTSAERRSDELPRRVPGSGGFPAPEQDSQLPPPSVSTGSTPVVPNYSSQPYGDQSFGDQSFGDQSYGDQSYGYRDQGTGGFESFGSDALSGWPGSSGSGTGSFGTTGTGVTPSANGQHSDAFSFDAYTSTGGFEAQPYQSDIYSTGSDALTSRKPEESTDFIPRYGTASSATPQSTGPMSAVEGGATTSSGARKVVADAGPGTEFSTPVDLFTDDDDDEDDKVSSATAALGASGKASAGKKIAKKSKKADDSEETDDSDEDEQPRSRRSRRALKRRNRVEDADDVDDSDEEENEDEPRSRRSRRALKRRNRVEDADDVDDSDEEENEDEEPRSRKSRRALKRRNRLDDADVPAGLSAEDVDTVADEPSPTNLKVWLSLAGQLVLGAIGGAALWIGFSYLWQRIPVAALIAAVAAIVGLVMLVRAIRRSDDLQTTMLAVLVGLVVTMSPAVLLLTVR